MREGSMSLLNGDGTQLESRPLPVATTLSGPVRVFTAERNGGSETTRLTSAMRP